MILYSFLVAIAFFALASMTNWRRGLYLFIVIGLIQDPVRKLIPGVPGYLVLATVPIWFMALSRLIMTIPYWRRAIKGYYPKFHKSVGFLVLSMLPAAAISGTYGPGSWQLTLVGAFSYGTILLGLVLGFWYANNLNMLRKLLAFYCVCASIMMTGTLLEYLGYPLPTLGTAMFGTKWIRHIPGEIIEMVTGFFRSPDVMGWHAVMLAMIAITLTLSGKGAPRWFWILLAIWGGGLAILCGRRKMVFMLPFFIATMTWLHWSLRGQMQKISLIFVLLSCLGGGYFFYQYINPHDSFATYYTDNPGDVFDRFEKHGFEALLVTYDQYGFFGAGLGTATQGAHHLKVARPRTWQEGGISRIMVELGVPGLLCFLYFGFVLVSTCWRVVTKFVDTRGRNFSVWAGLFTIMLVNLASFVVSGQIFGDPFISCLFAFLIGALLSAARLEGQPGAGAERTHAPLIDPGIADARHTDLSP